MTKLALISLAPLLALATAAVAEDGILLDYRDQAFLAGSAFYSEADRRTLADALEGAPDGLSDAFAEDFAILGDVSGSFTAAGADERLYLVQASAPVEIDPFPQGPAPLLVTMNGSESTGFFRLSNDVQYQRLVAAADGDGDGRDEVLLETAFMNMGQSVVSVDVVALATDGTAAATETLDEVYIDGCENPAGARKRTASTVSSSPDGFKVETHQLDCP